MQALNLFRGAVLILSFQGALSCTGTDNNAGAACDDLIAAINRCVLPDGAGSGLRKPDCKDVIGIRDSAKFASECVSKFQSATCADMSILTQTPPAACQELVVGDLFAPQVVGAAGGGGAPPAAGGAGPTTGGAPGSGGTAGAGGTAGSGGTSGAGGAGGAADASVPDASSKD
jgi:hypothetical protein